MRITTFWTSMLPFNGSLKRTPGRKSCKKNPVVYKFTGDLSPDSSGKEGFEYSSESSVDVDNDQAEPVSTSSSSQEDDSSSEEAKTRTIKLRSKNDIY